VNCEPDAKAEDNMMGYYANDQDQ
jgi:hypothetical protein